MRSTKVSAILFAAVLIIGLTTGCRKKTAVAAPAPPPTVEVPPLPKPPTAMLVVEPARVERGHSATLRWSTTDAADVKISQLGVVSLEGQESVRPDESTTFTLTATGAGGSVVATASIEVTVPPPPLLPPPPPLVKSLEERVAELSDAYFDFDKSDLTDLARAALTADASALQSIFADFPGAVLSLDGHCDERGSAQYNLALGERRTVSASAFLEALGVNTNRLHRISYGNEKPQCTDATEECWQRNRRVHFSLGEQLTQDQRREGGEVGKKAETGAGAEN